MLPRETYLSIGQLLPVRCEVEENSSAGTGQCDTPDEEDDQDNVGK